MQKPLELGLCVTLSPRPNGVSTLSSSDFGVESDEFNPDISTTLVGVPALVSPGFGLNEGRPSDDEFFSPRRQQ